MLAPLPPARVRARRLFRVVSDSVVGDSHCENILCQFDCEHHIGCRRMFGDVVEALFARCGRCEALLPEADQEVWAGTRSAFGSRREWIGCCTALRSSDAIRSR